MPMDHSSMTSRVIVQTFVQNSYFDNYYSFFKLTMAQFEVLFPRRDTEIWD